MRGVGELLAQRRTIERDGVAALRGAIEPDAVRVGAVVVDRRPVGAACVLHVDPRAGAVVVALGHDVVQAERRHVVDDRLARAQHHLFDGRDEALVAARTSCAATRRRSRRRRGCRPTRAGRRRTSSPGRRDGRTSCGRRRRSRRRRCHRTGAPAVAPKEPSARRATGDPGPSAKVSASSTSLNNGARYARCVPCPRYSWVICSSSIEVEVVNRREQRVKRLARLKVDGAVLDLQADVGAEQPVERRQLAIGLLRPILGDVGLVDEGPPDHDGAAAARARRRARSRHPRACDRSPAARAGLRSSP